MMDGKWLAFPGSHVEMGFSLCPSAGLHDWSDELGNTEWGVNRVWDRWGGGVFFVTAKPKSDPDSLCSLQSPTGTESIKVWPKVTPVPISHSFFWQSALPLLLLSSSTFLSCHILFSGTGFSILYVSRGLSRPSWMTFLLALTWQWPITQRKSSVYIN